jgi:predicted transport protein
MAMKNPGDMVAAVSASMAARTGRTVDEWVTLVNASGIDPLDQNAVRRWLKAEHGMLQNSSYAIADAAAKAAGWVEPTLEQYIDGQYAGAKAALRPIFDRLRTVIEGFGDDVTAEGRATYTPFVRRRQFVAVAAATRTRVDVGLRYTEPPASPLLTPANAPGQATHKLSLSSADEISDEIVRLLRTAYEQNG